jgi:hypothetical protein
LQSQRGEQRKADNDAECDDNEWDHIGAGWAPFFEDLQQAKRDNARNSSTRGGEKQGIELLDRNARGRQ